MEKVLDTILLWKEAALKPLIARTLVIGKRNHCYFFVVLKYKLVLMTLDMKQECI